MTDQPRDRDLVTYECVRRFNPGDQPFRADATGDKFRIVVPTSWKLTYGAEPSTKETILRVYDSEGSVRAVYRGVEEFRDISLPYLHEEGGEWRDIDIS